MNQYVTGAVIKELWERNQLTQAELPRICIGITIAVFAANHCATKKAKEEGKEYGNYIRKIQL